MAYRNFDEYLARLEEAECVTHLPQPYSSHNAGTDQSQNNALWFTEHGTEAPFSVVTNLFSTEQQMAWALGVDNIGQLEQKLTKLLDINMDAGPTTLMARASEFMSVLRSAGLFGGRSLQKSPYVPMTETTQHTLVDLLCNAIGLTAQMVYQSPLHQQQRTTGVVITSSADGTMQATSPVIQPGWGELPVALIIGGDPAAIWAAHMPMPARVDPYWMAGWLRRKQLPITRTEHYTFDVPANAEIVIEGVLDTDQPTCNGCNKHEFTYPLRVLGISSTANPIIPLVDINAYWLRKAEERVFLPIARTFLQDLCDINITHSDTDSVLAVASTGRPSRATALMHGLWGTDQIERASAIITVDQSVDVHNPEAVAFTLAHNVNWDRDMLINRRPGAEKADVSYGIDATRPNHTPSRSTDPAITRPHIVWQGQLLIVPAKAGEDTNELIATLWALQPTYHLLITNKQADLQDISSVFYDVLKSLNWEIDIIFSENSHNRIAINAAEL